MSDETQQFRIAEIEVAKSMSDETIVGIFRFDNQGRPRQGPTLLVLADIHSTLYAYERLLDVINSTAEQTRHLVSQVDQDPLGRFEKLVQRLNESVAVFARDEATPIQWSRVNIFILEMSEGHLCFTGTGRLMNTFLQKQADGSFRPFDLLGSLEQPEHIDSEKPFSSIICGDISVGDILIAGTSNLERLRADLRINERLTTLPPVTAAMEIKQDLEKRGIPDDFVAVVVASCEIKSSTVQLPLHLEAEAEKTDAPTASIEKLRDAEDEANQHLSPVISPVNRLQDTGEKLKSTALKLGSGAAGFIKKLGKGKKHEQINDPVALASLRSMNAGYRTGFTKKHKTIVILVVVAIAILAGGIVWWNHSKKVAAEIAAWNTTYESAVDNRNRAESDLVYGNELRARSEIEQAEKIATGIQSPLPDRKAKLQKLAADIKDLRERLKKVVKTEDVTDLYSAAAGAEPGSLGGVLVTKDQIYVVDHASHEIIKISPTTRETKRISLPTSIAGVISADEGKDSILFSTADGKLLALNKSTDLAKPMAWSHVKSSSTQDVALYGGKLYRLDPGNNQIWRSTNSGGAFGSESSYIKAADVSLGGAVSLAIDSNVYVLKNDGQLLQFLSGAQVSFGLSNIDPMLRAASSLWTTSDSNIFVITDPADKRILVYEKNGSLKAQITSSKFNELRDLSVDEAGKRIYAIDGNRLISMPLP
ncbi:MAG: hypothetical protein WC551_05090 [Patescibacteria group bacterium]